MLLKRFALLLITVVALATSAEAVVVTYWKNENGKLIDYRDRGEVQKWGHKVGITLKLTRTGNERVLKRDEIIEVTLDESDRDEAFNKATREQDAAALRAISQDADKPTHIRENAGYWSASIQGSVSAWKQFASAFPNGVYTLDALTKLAKLQLAKNDSRGSLKTLQTLNALGGNLARARANQMIGEINIAEKNYTNAESAFSNARSAADSLSFMIDRIKAQAWSGVAAEKLDKGAAAKAFYEEAVKLQQGSDRSDFAGLNLAKGSAEMGLARLSGDKRDSYLRYQKATFWISGRDLEGECLVEMLRIADAMAASSKDTDKEWGEARASKIRLKLRQLYPNHLKKYDKE